jgi:hypothetical protein
MKFAILFITLLASDGISGHPGKTGTNRMNPEQPASTLGERGEGFEL